MCSIIQHIFSRRLDIIATENKNGHLLPQLVPESSIWNAKYPLKFQAVSGKLKNARNADWPPEDTIITPMTPWTKNQNRQNCKTSRTE